MRGQPSDSNEHQRTVRGMCRWKATCGDEEEDLLAPSRLIADKQDGVAKNDASNLVPSKVKSTQQQPKSRILLTFFLSFSPPSDANAL